MTDEATRPRSAHLQHNRKTQEQTQKPLTALPIAAEATQRLIDTFRESAVYSRRIFEPLRSLPRSGIANGFRVSLRRPSYARCVCVGLLAALLGAADTACAEEPAPLPGVATLAADSSNDSTVTVQADYGTQFQMGRERVVMLRGSCRAPIDGGWLSAPQLIVWIPKVGEAVQAYAEGTPDRPVVIERGGRRESRGWFLTTLAPASFARVQARLADLNSPPDDPLLTRAIQRRKTTPGLIQQAQYIPPAPSIAAAPWDAPGPIGIRRHVTISPRFLGESFVARGEVSQATVPAEYIITVTGGVKIVVDNVPLQIDGQILLTRVDLTADRAVIWTDADRLGELGGFDIDADTPFQVYLEGNIVARQGLNEVRATHAFYNVNERRGLLMNAEVRTFIPEYEGTLRLRAAEVRQFSETSFHARNAWFTTSEFGHPKYRVEASDVYLEERVVPGGRPDPETGLPDNGIMWLTSVNNRLIVEDVPLLRFPYISGPAEDPNIPIRELNVGYSGMFGWEINTLWNMEGLLGLELPAGANWDLELDYLSKRGPAIGTEGEYDLFGSFFGAPARYQGLGDIYYINDTGTDNLGLGRRELAPINDNRGRVKWQNRIDLPASSWITTEVGYIFNDDRNFLEQYFEGEWDTGKDQETLVTANQQLENLTASLMFRGRVNDFSNQTDWLPKADLTILGEPLFGTPVIWSSHSSVGYGNVKPAEAPPDPMADPFQPLGYYQDVAGVVAMSRHELSLPFNVGAVKVVPYALGEAAYWEEDVTRDQLTRWYGGAGVRASVQFNKVMPQVRSRVLGLNGLAHKMNFDVDYFFAESSADLAQVAQYNEFDDDAQERFQERFIPLEYGGALPAIYDPRTYAVRAGAGTGVTVPYHELVDSQHVVRLGWHHRWQTKVGPPERQRIIDWMELDLGAALFPDPDQDNFGEELGLLSARYAWHLSARTSVLANAIYDVFDGGQEVWNVGVLSQRSARGSVYVGFRQVQTSAVDSQLLTGSFSYVLTPKKWITTFGTSFDVAEGLDRGQSLTVTRIGEYFLLHFGAAYDRSRNNVGVALSLEPKFGSFGGGSMQLNSLLGLQ